MVMWKTGLSCRSFFLYRCSGKQVNFSLGKSMKEKKFKFLHNIYSTELIHCADIHLCHSDLFPSQN